MNKALTPKQARLLRFIRSRIDAERDPSYRDLAKLMGVSSVNTISAMLKILERKGYIEKDFSAARSIRVTESKRVLGKK